MTTAADRARRLNELRDLAINEGLPLVERIRAELERMAIVDEILEEHLSSRNGYAHRGDR